MGIWCVGERFCVVWEFLKLIDNFKLSRRVEGKKGFLGVICDS